MTTKNFVDMSMEELQEWFCDRWEDNASRHSAFDVDLAQIMTEAFDKGFEQGFEDAKRRLSGRP